MLELLPAPADDVVALRIDGKVTDAEYDALVATIEQKLERHERLRVYGEYVAFNGAPFRTYLRDVAMGFKHWNDFSRAVVVTDKAWVESVVKAIGRVAPVLRTRAFPFEERDRAMKWLLSEA
jgi:hypothetical protein